MLRTVGEGITIERDERHVYRVKGDPRVPEGLKLTSVTTVLNVINKPALVPWARNMSLSKVRAVLLGKRDEKLAALIAAAEGDPDEGFEKWVEEMLAEARALPDLVRDDAGDVGTAAHGVIEEYIKEGLTPDQMLDRGAPRELDHRVTMAVGNFAEWYRDSGLTITQSELMVYHPTEHYAGTMDAAGIMPCPCDGNVGSCGGTCDVCAAGECCGGLGVLHVAIDFKTSNGLYEETCAQIAAYSKAHEAMGGPKYHSAMAVRFGKVDADFEARWLASIDESFTDFLAAKRLHEHGTKKKLVWA